MPHTHNATARTRRAGGVLAAVTAFVTAGALLVACGSGSKLAAGGASSGSSASSGAGASSAVSAKTSAGAAASSTAASVTGNSNSSFCKLAAAEQAEQDKDNSALGDTPAQIQQYEEKAMNALPAFVAAAPAQIKGAVQVIYAADQKLYAALKAANFDYTKIDPTVTAALEDPTFTAATTTVGDYLENVCGINPTDDTTS